MPRRRAAVVLLAVTAAPAAEPPARTDLHGDPLPPGTVARLGTTRLRPGPGAVVAAFSADGRIVVTSGPKGNLRVWDRATGKLPRRGDALLTLAPPVLTPDGRRLR
jgi:hypothetical protein